jgi:hypothetical protein
VAAHLASSSTLDAQQQKGSSGLQPTWTVNAAVCNTPPVWNCMYTLYRANNRRSPLTRQFALLDGVAERLLLNMFRKSRAPFEHVQAHLVGGND